MRSSNSGQLDLRLDLNFPDPARSKLKMRNILFIGIPASIGDRPRKVCARILRLIVGGVLLTLPLGIAGASPAPAQEQEPQQEQEQAEVAA